MYIKQFFFISFNICQKLETQQGKKLILIANTRVLLVSILVYE